MGRPLSRSRTTIADHQQLDAADVAASASYTAVVFEDGSRSDISRISSGAAISASLRAVAQTQPCFVRVLARPTRAYPEQYELVSPVEVAVGVDTEIYAGVVRDAELEVQLIEGGTPGGVVTFSLCLK